MGRVLTDDGLEPIQTLLQRAPEILLNTIYLETDCIYNCGCKKVGLICSATFTTFKGQSCCNLAFYTSDEDTYDTNEEILYPSCYSNRQRKSKN